METTKQLNIIMTNKLLKSLAVSVAAMFIFVSEADAFRPMRKYKFDISVNVSAGDPTSALQYYERPGLSHSTPPMVSDLYSEGMVNIEYTGLYTVRFESKLNKWLAVGGDISALRMTGDLYKGFDNRHRKSMTGNAIYVMPEVRFFYFTSKLSTLSGALQGGAGFYDGFSRKASAEFQIIPFSYTLGSRIYGRAELTFGSMMNGMTFGVGCRF